MTYADEQENYVPVDNFTVTIPKTLDVNPKEDSIYNIEVQGTIDADRSVWVCADESVTLTLTDESLASTYGITKTQTLTNTLDRIQYTSEEIAEGYIGQGTIAKSPLDYEVECEYAGSINFYINVLDDENVLTDSIRQNGFMSYSADIPRAICKACLPEDVYEKMESRLEYTYNNIFPYNTDSFKYEEYATYGYCEYGNEVYLIYICVPTTDLDKKCQITKRAEIVNGKYAYQIGNDEKTWTCYEIDINSYAETVTIKSTTTAQAYREFSTADKYAYFMYLSPRCTYIIE